MARKIAEEDFAAILDAAANGATAQQIERALGGAVKRRTLQYRLKSLVDANRLVREGKGPSAKYRPPRANEAPEEVIGGEARVAPQGDLFIPVSKTGADIQK